jgi:hypothetical protein
MNSIHEMMMSRKVLIGFSIVIIGIHSYPNR